jgi:hypothetical protein
MMLVRVIDKERLEHVGTDWLDHLASLLLAPAPHAGNMPDQPVS